MAAPEVIVPKNVPPPVPTTPDFSKMSDEEKWRYNHRLMHEKHKGHEAMHAEMMLILVVTLITAQFVLLFWRTKHFRSYQLATLVGMWLIPLMFCLYHHWIRFIIVWAFFSVITAFVLYKSMQKPLSGSTPRWVYKWFLLLYKVCYGFGLFGYACLIFTIFGINMLLMIKPDTAMEFSLLVMFYALYFGVVSRDFAEVCSDKMAAQIGYYTPNGLPGRALEPNMCAVCNDKILVTNNEEAIIEQTYTLTCDHVFHEFCIRGWCIVGKKQTCPYCNEKVDLKRLFSNPWEKTTMYYSTLLDWIRFLIAWQPVIVMVVKGINWSLSLE